MTPWGKLSCFQFWQQRLEWMRYRGEVESDGDIGGDMKGWGGPLLSVILLHAPELRAAGFLPVLICINPSFIAKKAGDTRSLGKIQFFGPWPVRGRGTRGSAPDLTPQSLSLCQTLIVVFRIERNLSGWHCLCHSRFCRLGAKRRGRTGGEKH